MLIDVYKRQAMRLELNAYASGMYAIRIAAYDKESIKKFSKL